MVQRGLNLEGACTNPSCRASNVIIPVKLEQHGTNPGVFDLIEDVDSKTSASPACHHFVRPITCGFWDCWWRWSGKMKSSLETPSRVVQSVGWKRAGHHDYMRFDESAKEQVCQGLVYKSVHTRIIVCACGQ